MLNTLCLMLEHQSSTSAGSRHKQQGSVQSKRNMFATNSELEMFRATEDYDANNGEIPVWERPPRSPTQMELTSSILSSCRLASKQANLVSLDPTQSQLSRPVSSRHHISMEHRLRRKQLNFDTNASNKTYLKEVQKKEKMRLFLEKK